MNTCGGEIGCDEEDDKTCIKKRSQNVAAVTNKEASLSSSNAYTENILYLALNGTSDKNDENTQQGDKSKTEGQQKQQSERYLNESLMLPAEEETNLDSNCVSNNCETDEYGEIETPQSPASTQGSMSSTECLYQDIELIKAGTCQTRDSMCDPALVLPKVQQTMLSNYLKESFPRICEFFCADLNSHLLKSGQKQDDPHNACQLLKHFEDPGNIGIDNIIMLARIGKFFMEKFTNQKASGKGIPLEAISTQPPFTAEEDLLSTLANEPSSCAQNNLLQNEDNNGIEVPDFGAEMVDTNVPESESEWKGINILSEVFNNAYEISRKKTKSKDKKLPFKRAVQILFDVIFTDEEKLQCSISGRKTKSGKETQPFDQRKLRCLKRALAWLKTNPSVRTMDELKRNDVELDSEDEDCMRTTISESSCNYRRKHSIPTDTDRSIKTLKKIKRK